MLSAFDDVDVVGEAVDGADAVAQCARLAPDAIFLDMQMPALDGFGVLATVGSPRPAFVMVTAFEEHAVHAFDTDIIDYLLKPVAVERLERAVQRLRAAIGGVDAGAVPAMNPPPSPSTLLFSDRGKTEVVKLSDVEWLESADNYVQVHSAGRSALVRRTLAGLLNDVGPSFVRIHRCFAVQVGHVLGVHAGTKGDATVVLRGGIQLPCSRQHRPTLMTGLRSLATSGTHASCQAVGEPRAWHEDTL